MICTCLKCGENSPLESNLSDSLCSNCGGNEYSVVWTVPVKDPRPKNLKAAYEQLIFHPSLKKWDREFLENNWFRPFNKMSDKQKLWLEQVYSRYEDDLSL